MFVLLLTRVPFLATSSLTLGYFRLQCHPKPSIWPWTFCSESLYIFSLRNTLCPIAIDFFGSQQMSAYQFDLGQFQCHPKPPIWLEPPLPHPSFYSTLLFSFKTHLRRLFLHGTICSAPTNLAVSRAVSQLLVSQLFPTIFYNLCLSDRC